MLRKHSSDDGLEMMQMPYPVWDENDVVHGEVFLKILSFNIARRSDINR
jgi:hypothetical protein